MIDKISGVLCIDRDPAYTLSGTDRQRTKVVTTFPNLSYLRTFKYAESIEHGMVQSSSVCHENTTMNRCINLSACNHIQRANRQSTRSHHAQLKEYSSSSSFTCLISNHTKPTSYSSRVRSLTIRHRLSASRLG